MTESLADALELRRAAIEAGLVEARAELQALRTRTAEVEALIERAEAALGEPVAPTTKERRMTLHTALAHILRENDNRWMSARELSEEVNRRHLYRKRDGSPVQPNQVHARTNNYSEIFEKEGPRIRLRLEATERDVLIFRDDDEGFFAWLDENPDGFFVNAERTPNPKYLVLHRSTCPHFDRSPALHWTNDYIKIASGSRNELEEWSSDVVGGEVTLCRSCFG